MESTESLFGYPIRRWPIAVAGRTLEIVGPANEDELLEAPEVQARFDEDEYLPYWGQLWPAAAMLAEAILADESGRDRRALEVGCGLGLSAVAARLAGWEVLATDYDEDALQFASENARLNGVGDLEVRALDWRHPDVFDRFDRIFASDVLYERRNHQPIAELIQRLLAEDGVALLADPNRQMARGFDDVLGSVGLALETAPTHANQPYGRYVDGTIYRIRR